MPRKAMIRPRRGSAAQWAAAEAGGPALATGELGLVGNSLVVGDGATVASSLPSMGSDTFARPAGQKMIIIGDSWTTYEGGNSVSTPVQPLGGNFDSKGSWNVANVLLGHSFVMLGNAGIGGQTSSQILARFDSDVIARRPDWVRIQAGTNDLNASFDTMPNIAAMLDKARAAGINVLINEIPPRSDAAGTLAVRQYYMQVNRWLREQARARKGVYLLPLGAAIADPATTWQALSGTLAGDNVHPSAAGAMAAGAAIANAIRSLTPSGNSLLAVGNGEPGNLLSNPMMVGTGATAPTDWTVGGSPTISYVPRVDGIAGSWMQLAVAHDASANATSNATVGAGVEVGDTVMASVEFACDSLDPAPSAGKQGPPRLCIQFWTGASWAASKAYDLYWDSGYGNARYPGSWGILQTPAITVPAGVTTVQVLIVMNGGGNYRFHRAALRKVPAGTTAL